MNKTPKNFVPSTGYDPEVAPFDMNVTLEDISNKEIKGKNESGICLNPPLISLGNDLTVRFLLNVENKVDTMEFFDDSFKLATLSMP